MNRGLEVADRSGQAWSSFKAKNIRRWSGVASPLFPLRLFNSLTSQTWQVWLLIFRPIQFFFFNLQFRLSLQKFWLTATVEAFVLILVPISKSNIFPQIMHQRNPISNFPIQFQIWIAQGLFVICVAPSFCLLPILTRPQINAWQWNNSCRQIFTNANIIFSHFLYKLQIFGWDFASTAWQSQQNMTAKGRHTVTKKKLSNTRKPISHFWI